MQRKGFKKKMHPLEWAINIDLVLKIKIRNGIREYMCIIYGRHPEIIGILTKKEPRKSKKKTPKKIKNSKKSSSLSLIEESSSIKTR